jgi:hypothetical protein
MKVINVFPKITNYNPIVLNFDNQMYDVPNSLHAQLYTWSNIIDAIPFLWQLFPWLWSIWIIYGILYTTIEIVTKLPQDQSETHNSFNIVQILDQCQNVSNLSDFDL